jgi:hypothetical protein
LDTSLAADGWAAEGLEANVAAGAEAEGSEAGLEVDLAVEDWAAEGAEAHLTAGLL